MTDKITNNARRGAETTDRGSETDYMSIPAGPSGMARRGEKENRPRPGPASSKTRYHTRSRSGSASSVSSVSSSASTAIIAERRSRREAAQEVNRLAIQLVRVKGGGSPTVLVDSDESDEEVEYREKRHPCKRKLSEDSEEETAEEDAKRKQGRPQNTGLYVKRAEALEKVNQKKREEAELDNERIIKALSSGQIFESLERDLDDAVEELSDAPTADVASQARKCMAGVLKATKCSKNLKGGIRKIINHAAVKGAASTEVLRTRADSSGSDHEATRQIKELKRELEKIRVEAQSAREEATRAKEESERLRQELAEIKSERETRRCRRVLLEKSPPSSPEGRKKMEKGAQAVDTTEAAPSPVEEVTETPMEVEIATEEAVQEKPPKYDDERRKKEILPPPEEWPAAVRPALKGRVKILEDRPLTGHKVRLVDEGRKTKKAEPSTVVKVAEEEKGAAHLLLQQITPLLKKWLEESLRSMGFPKKPKGRDATADNATRQAGDGPKKAGQKADKPTRCPQTKGPEGTRAEAMQSTTVPNSALWSEVVGKKAGKVALPPQPTGQQSREKSSAAGPPNAADTGAWQTVANKRAKKTAGPKTGATTGRGKEGPSGGKPPAKEGKGKGTIPPSQGAQSRKAPKRRPPRTAAVTLTCPPDGYAEAMRVAQGAIDLHELGIKELRPKRAATGAIVLEVPGPNGAERAAVLKSRMEEALKDMEGVRVARPVKMADMRVRDLLASVSVDEVRGAMSSVGGCALHEIKAGEIRTAPNGLGTLWVQCPLRAANRVVAAGRLGIGWTSSRTEILEPRQLQCYRCLGRGHVQSACPSSIDRSGMCYRCSEVGHAAKTCANDPRCALCEELGLASGHRIGGKACKAPKRNPRFPKTAVTASVERMEVEVTSPVVRGGTRKSANPVPARRSRDKEESKMEVETNPESQQPPPLRRRSPRIAGGMEEPTTRPSSSPPKE